MRKKKPNILSPLMTTVQGPHPIRRDELEELLAKQTQYALELEYLFWGSMEHSTLCSFTQGSGDECDCAPGGRSWIDYLLEALHNSNPCPHCRVPMGKESSLCSDCGYSG